MGNRKSQVTIFVMLGVVILMIILLITSAQYELNKLNMGIPFQNYDIKTGLRALETGFESSSIKHLNDGIYEFGLDEYELENYMKEKVDADLNSIIAELESQGIDVEKGELDFDLTVNENSIVVEGKYDIKLTQNDEVQTLKEFRFVYPLTNYVDLDLDEDCISKVDHVLYSVDTHAKLEIPKGTSMRYETGACLNRIGIKTSPETNDLSVFTVNWDLLPQRAITDPPIEMEMEYNQEKFDEVQAELASQGYDVTEEELSIGYHDSGSSGDSGGGGSSGGSGSHESGGSSGGGGVYRPHDAHGTHVNTVDNTITARTATFTPQTQTLAGCKGTGSTKYYTGIFAESIGTMENPMNVMETQPCTKYKCEDAINGDESITFTIPTSRTSCHNDQTSVSVYAIPSTGDSMTINGGTVATITTAGSHTIQITSADRDNCGEPPGTKTCSFAYVIMKIEGVGFEPGNGLMLYSGEGEPTLPNVYYGLDGNKYVQGPGSDPATPITDEGFDFSEDFDPEVEAILDAFVDPETTQQEQQEAKSFEDAHKQDPVLNNPSSPSSSGQGNVGQGDTTGLADDGSCFIAGTKILMEDGSLKNIEDVKIGEKVIGYNNQINTVLDYLRPIIGNRDMYIINDKIEFTEDQPLLTKEGWKVVNYELFKKYRKTLDLNPKHLQVGDIMVTENGYEIVKTLEKNSNRPYDEVVYDFHLDGDNTYIANGYVVHNC